MQLIINDTPQQFAQGLTVSQLLEALKQPALGVAVAVNAQVVSKSQWSQTRLQEADRITLFKVVAGG
ncbi:sulfur carrier protein ThiS [Bowmanella yangjiangensis]|uniref:Sulfur carrier protein ThiS n=1 Tax=Bowmanella yangjiangensis TaxID=2811230 RepID=A0ABS3CQX3_9ALTE|nr:sulfur carrier protein ThiS [Bowmanella yangjiangensis]MBN7818695.1 sulfur carrier protein ThiS [Bowmanella yangjiangensis]